MMVILSSQIPTPSVIVTLYVVVCVGVVLIDAVVSPVDHKY